MRPSAAAAGSRSATQHLFIHHGENWPWEDDNVNHWQGEEAFEGDMPHALTRESSFAVLFQSYRERDRR